MVVQNFLMDETPWWLSLCSGTSVRSGRPRIQTWNPHGQYAPFQPSGNSPLAQLPVSCRNAHFHADTRFTVPDAFALVLWSRALQWSVSTSVSVMDQTVT